MLEYGLAFGWDLTPGFEGLENLGRLFALAPLGLQPFQLSETEGGDLRVFSGHVEDPAGIRRSVIERQPAVGEIAHTVPL